MFLQTRPCGGDRTQPCDDVWEGLAATIASLKTNR